MDHYDVPFALTQMGIAENVLIHRAAAARGLNELKEKGLVVSHTKHVIRGKRKRKVYFLTEEGLQAAEELERHLLESSVSVAGKGSSERKWIEIGMIVGRSTGPGEKPLFGGTAPSLLTVCNHLNNGFLDLDTIEQLSMERTSVPGEPAAAGRPVAAGRIPGGTTESGSGRDGTDMMPYRPPAFYSSPDIPVIPNFTGRREELAHILRMIHEGSTSGIVIQGLAGIGKTSLAARVAHEFRGKRDVFWIELHRWTGFQGFVSRLLGLVSRRKDPGRRPFRVPIADIETGKPGENGKHRDGKSLYRKEKGREPYGEEFESLLELSLDALRKSPVLIVLDDIQNASSTIQDFMGALLKQMKNVRDAVFLMTTRTMPGFYDRRLVAVEKRVAEITLPGLTFDEAFDLVNSLMASHEPGSPHETPSSGILSPGDGFGDGFREIDRETRMNAPFSPDVRPPFTREEFRERYDATRGHPFALELLSSMGLSSAKLDFERFLNDEIFESLPEEERSVLMFSSVFRLPLDIEPLQEAMPDSGVSKRHVESLIRKNILKERNGLLFLHALIKDFAGSCLSQEMYATCHRAAAHYYARLIDRVEEEGGPEPWINEHRMMIEQIHHLLESGEHDRAVRLIIEKADELISYGYGEFYDVLQHVDKDRIDEKWREDMLEIMGDAHAEFGYLDEAFRDYTERLEHAKDGSAEEARMLRKISDLEKEKGNIDSSIALRKRSLNIFQKTKDLLKTASIYNELGLDYWKKREFEDARNFFIEALELLGEKKKNDAVARVLLNLTQLEIEANNLDEAGRFIERSLAAATSESEKIEIFHLSGDLFIAKGQESPALETYGKGLEIARKEKAFREMMYFMERISDLYAGRGKNAAAVEVLSSGIDLIESESRKEEGEEISLVHAHPAASLPGSLQMFSRKRKEAVHAPGESAERARGTGLTRKQEALKLDNYRFAALCEKAAFLLRTGDGPVSGRANAYSSADAYGRADAYSRKAADIYSGFGDDGKAAAVLLENGKYAMESKELNNAVLCYREAYALFHREGNKKGCAISLLNFAGVLELIETGEGSSGKKIRLYRKALELSEQAGFRRGMDISSNKLKELEKSRPEESAA